VTKKRIAFIAALGCALGAPAAAAGAVTVGQGDNAPGVAVDAAGTAYIAWDNHNTLQFCRLPRGASACDISHSIAAPGATTLRAFVAVSGSRVVVVQYRYPLTGADPPPAIWAFTSTNRGASFDAGHSVGTLPFFDAVFGPGDTLSGVTNNQAAFQNVPLDGGSAGAAFATLSTDYLYQGTVGLLDAATPLAVFTGAGDTAVARRYDGSGSLNDATNWTPAEALGVARYPKLAGGPSGLFLLATAADDHTVFARKWTGSAFGAAATVGGGATSPTLAAFEDAAGRLHAVFERGDANGLHLIHAVSDDGATWRSGTAASQNPGTEGGFADTRIATAPDHVGVAVWRAHPTSNIRITAVGPDAPATAAPPAPPAPTPTAPSIVKRRPNLSATGTARRVGRKVRVRISAKLLLPSGISSAAGCKGKVRISIARGTKVLASKTVTVRSTCKFTLHTKLKRSKVKRARKLLVTIRFRGNDVLTSRTRRGSVKVK
jgi:hypothetical protein